MILLLANYNLVSLSLLKKRYFDIVLGKKLYKRGQSKVEKLMSEFRRR